MQVTGQDVRLHVVYGSRSIDGGPDKPTLLFVHGYPDTHRTWHHQMAALGGACHVVACDLRGAGQSGAPAALSGYRIEAILPDLTAVIEAVTRPGEQIHLVAHDWGALICWRYVSDPALAARVASYTAIAGPHPDMAATLMRQRLTSGRPGDLLEALRQVALSWYILMFQVPGLAEWGWRRDWQRLWVGIHRKGGCPPDDPILQATQDEVLSAALCPLNLYRQLAHGLFKAPNLPKVPIAVPVSLLIPDHDLALSARLYDNVPDYVNDLEVHHLDANHWVYHSHPEQVNDLIRTFVHRHAGMPIAAD